MTLRTARLVGSAYSDADPVNLTVTWNGIEVWNAPVKTRDMEEKTTEAFTPRDVLCEWTFPMDVHGSVPIRIDVTNGELAWQAVWCNHAFLNGIVALKPQTNWPIRVPTSVQEAYDDWEHLSREEWIAKYGAESVENFETKIISPADQNFGSAWWMENMPGTDNDGKKNVRIDGVSCTMDTSMRRVGMMGDWVWRVYSGQTLEADVTIDAPHIDTDLG